MPKLRVDQYLSIFSIILLLCLAGVYQGEALSYVKELPPLQLIQSAPVPVRTATNSAQLVEEKSRLNNITAESYLVLDLDSAAILLNKNAEETLYPASTTKMMTAVLTQEFYNPNQVIIIDKEAFTTGNKMGLRIGEKIQIKDLLAGLLIASGNDAAFALANNFTTGYQGFVDEMNKMATKLHLQKTNFTNPSGLDDHSHLTSAWDLGILARELLKDNYLRELVATPEKIVTDLDGKIIHRLYNTHALLGQVEGVKGIKTGTTLGAGEVLVTLVEREDKQILIVLMGSKARYNETRQIIDWIFAHYQWQEVILN